MTKEQALKILREAAEKKHPPEVVKQAFEVLKKTIMVPPT